ncbi:hypothetical protein K450DRAFT_246291 [Umbelopsis ramanniana AG]|uniref:Eisosome component PIL1-domain-containing protein n=1 Tax=Umbelopsis ramanniana AG TaxID=1314678 RepID=A0AAD5E7I0_UMBRA|nr:uncharacterized protein K450DRAFT_246291 [Umbelopsis ramanniana AG]KAI8578543.1 hypothetical protein K450DRAFT_246291 [Umbelopsis ramanniana AG]
MSSINPFHQIRTHLAKSAGNIYQDDKHFYVFLQEEKNGLELFKQLAGQRRQAGHAMVTYGRPLGDDLTDVTDKVGQLMNCWSDVLQEFANNFEQYRNTFKTIAEREKVLMSDREKKRSLEDRIHSTQRNQPEAVHRINEFKTQLADLEQKMLPAETEIGNYKRMATKEALYLLFNGMHELGSKTDIIATTAKYCADQVNVHPIQPGEQREPYRGTTQTSNMVKDAKRALDSWTPDQNKVRRTLTSANRGRNPLVGRRRPSDVDKELPEIPEPSQSQDRLDAPNPMASLSTPTSQRDRVRHRTTSITNANDDEYDTRSSYRHSTPIAAADYDPRKPDEIRPPSPWDHHSPSPPSRGPSPTYPPGSYYLTPPEYQQYYQFYEQYTPPQPWEEAAGQLIRSPAVFHPTAHPTESRRDAGGFVLPGSVPSEHEPELRSPTPTSNPQTSEFNNAPKQQQDQQENTAKEDVKNQNTGHMPGNFPSDGAAKPDKLGKPEPSQTKLDTAKPSTANTTAGGGQKVSALLAKFQNLGNK